MEDMMKDFVDTANKFIKDINEFTNKYQEVPATHKMLFMTVMKNVAEANLNKWSEVMGDNKEFLAALNELVKDGIGEE